MEPIEGSETSAFKTQTPGKYPKENTLHFFLIKLISRFEVLAAVLQKNYLLDRPFLLSDN